MPKKTPAFNYPPTIPPLLINLIEEAAALDQVPEKELQPDGTTIYKIGHIRIREGLCSNCPCCAWKSGINRANHVLSTTHDEVTASSTVDSTNENDQPIATSTTGHVDNTKDSTTKQRQRRNDGRKVEQRKKRGLTPRSVKKTKVSAALSYTNVPKSTTSSDYNVFVREIICTLPEKDQDYISESEIVVNREPEQPDLDTTGTEEATIVLPSAPADDSDSDLVIIFESAPQPKSKVPRYSLRRPKTET